MEEMKTQPCVQTLVATCAFFVISLSSCSLLHHDSDASHVIYALPARQAASSPLVQPMTGIGKPFIFTHDRFVLTDQQTAILAKSAPQWAKDKIRLLIIGFAKRDLPPGYARVLAHRRAESVRQALIEQGLDAANLHSTGYGNDIPSLSLEDSVVIYQMK